MPYITHQATRGEDTHWERARFLTAKRHFSLPDTALLTGVTTVADWDTALRQLAAVLPDGAPQHRRPGRAAEAWAALQNLTGHLKNGPGVASSA